MSLLQFSEHFQLIFDNLNVNNDNEIKQKNCVLFFFFKLFRIIKFFFLILLREATLESIARCSSYTLVRPFPTLSFFPFFSQTFLELIFATKIKTMLFKQSDVLFTSCQKNIAYIICLNTYNIVHEYWVNKNACLNIVL